MTVAAANAASASRRGCSDPTSTANGNAFRFDEMLTYILIVLVMVVAVDLLSGWIRRRIA